MLEGALRLDGLNVAVDIAVVWLFLVDLREPHHPLLLLFAILSCILQNNDIIIPTFQERAGVLVLAHVIIYLSLLLSDWR